MVLGQMGVLGVFSVPLVTLSGIASNSYTYTTNEITQIQKFLSGNASSSYSITYDATSSQKLFQLSDKHTLIKVSSDKHTLIKVSYAPTNVSITI